MDTLSVEVKGTNKTNVDLISSLIAVTLEPLAIKSVVIVDEEGDSILTPDSVTIFDLVSKSKSLLKTDITISRSVESIETEDEENETEVIGGDQVLTNIGSND